MSNVKTIAAPFEEVRAASAPNGGTGLTTTLALISLPIGADWISLSARNFVTAIVAKYLFNPWLTIVATTTGLNEAARVITAAETLAFTDDISEEMQDGDTTDFAIDSLDTIANNGAIYVGSWLPFRGVQVDIGTGANATNSVLTVRYPNGVGNWTAVSGFTDGTISSSASMAIDGDVVWAVPDPWTRASLLEHGDTTIRAPWSMDKLYWTRWEWSVQLDSDVDVAQMRALNQSTAYSEWEEGKAFEMALESGPNGFACVEALVNGGTANLIVNVAAKLKTEIGLP